jgi:hypothetical protein
MSTFERIRELVTAPPTEAEIRSRSAEGWRMVSIEWERELVGPAGAVGGPRSEVPYGLRISDDCEHLEENPAEWKALELMLDLIARDNSLSQVAHELNRMGLSTRRGYAWTQTAVFNMLPRLIEAAPDIRRIQPAAAVQS